MHSAVTGLPQSSQQNALLFCSLFIHSWHGAEIDQAGNSLIGSGVPAPLKYFEARAYSSGETLG
jgi:hypothetical protein